MFHRPQNELIRSPGPSPPRLLRNFSPEELADANICHDIRDQLLQHLMLCQGAPSVQHEPLHLPMDRIAQLIIQMEQVQSKAEEAARDRATKEREDVIRYEALQRQLPEAHRLEDERRMKAYRQHQAAIAEIMARQVVPASLAPPPPPDVNTLITQKRMRVVNDKHGRPRMHHRPPESHFVPDGRFVHTWLFVHPKHDLKYIHVWYTWSAAHGWRETACDRGIWHR